MSFTMNNSGAAIEVIRDRNGTDQVLLRNIRGASAKVSLHGGHVLSLRTDRGEELVFTVARQFSSLRMRFEEGYLYVSHSLVSVDRLSNTGLPGTGIGSLTRIHHLYIQMIMMTRPISIYF